MTEYNSERCNTFRELVITLKTEVGIMKAQVADFSVIKETLVELKLLTKQSMEFNKVQALANREVQDCLHEINENLKTLNVKVEGLEKHDEEIDRQLKESSLSDHEVELEDKRLAAERFKAKFSFFGVIITAMLVLLGIIFPLAFPLQ